MNKVDQRRRARQLVLAWLPLAVILVGYAAAQVINSGIGDQPAQGSANGLGFALHISEPGMVDRWLFGGALPTIWLQDLAHRPSGPRWYDGVAALISVLLAVFLFSSAQWWARMLLVAYPILMGLSLVYTGEHYVIDVLSGGSSLRPRSGW